MYTCDKLNYTTYVYTYAKIHNVHILYISWYRPLADKLSLFSCARVRAESVQYQESGGRDVLTQDLNQLGRVFLLYSIISYYITWTYDTIYDIIWYDEIYEVWYKRNNRRALFFLLGCVKRRSYMLIQVERTTTPWLEIGSCTVFDTVTVNGLAEFVTPIGCGLCVAGQQVRTGTAVQGFTTFDTRSHGRRCWTVEENQRNCCRSARPPVLLYLKL